MWYIIGLIIIGGGLFISFNLKPKLGKSNINIDNPELKSINVNPNDTIKPVYTHKDILAKLKKLSETDLPKDLAFGAMCYELAAPSETASYTCPACMTKTIHKVKGEFKNYQKTELIRWGITACRNEMKDVKGINIKLDESQFCKKCAPNAREPQLGLLVNINKNKDTTKVWNINYIDIRLIKNFLNDDLKYKGEQDAEAPLVHRIDRIQELLGVKL